MQFIKQFDPAFGREFIARVRYPPEVAHDATAVTAMRQDQGDLVRSSQSTLEVVTEALQQVAKAIDGGLPACVDQGHCGLAASTAAIRGIAVTRSIVRARMRVHRVYFRHGRAWPFYPLTPRASANVKTATLANFGAKFRTRSARRANDSSPMTLFYFRVRRFQSSGVVFDPHTIITRRGSVLSLFATACTVFSDFGGIARPSGVRNQELLRIPIL